MRSPQVQFRPGDAFRFQPPRPVDWLLCDVIAAPERTAALLLEHRHGESFDGLVTGASTKGTWVRIFRPPAEGRLVHGFEGLDVGDRIHVPLIAVDVERGYIDFRRVGLAGK